MKQQPNTMVVGAVATLVLWGLAFVIMNAVYHGGFPLLPVIVAALLSPIVGGLAASRLSSRTAVHVGALSGGSAGLLILLAVAVASGIAPVATVGGLGMLAAGGVGGAIGGLLGRRRPKARA
jgi:hypothetical protein